MRGTEILLVVLACAGVARVVTPLRRWRPAGVATALVTAGAFTLHLLADGARWQLVPTYVVALAGAGLAVADTVRPCAPSRRRAPAACAGRFALVGGAVGWALPVAQLSAPDGPYPVGTTTTVLVDEARGDPYDPPEPRRLALQLWYPAVEGQHEDAETAPWMEQASAFGSVAAEWLALPGFALGHLDLVTSHARHDAPPVTGERFPLVIYAHGWSGFRNIHSTQLESLASHGYVVAAVDHVPGALAARYPDGEVVPIDPDALPSGAPEEEYHAASRLLMETFADDMGSVLAHLHTDGEIGRRLDHRRVAMIGHSTGGGAAILACARERRCRAAVGYDPWVEPLPDDLIGRGLDRPLLSLRSEEWLDNGNDRRLRRLHAASHEDSAPVGILGATHRDFTLLPMLSPLATRLGWSGPTGGAEIHRIVDEWTLGFLDHHVRDEPADPVTTLPGHDAVSIDRPTDG